MNILYRLTEEKEAILTEAVKRAITAGWRPYDGDDRIENPKHEFVVHNDPRLYMFDQEFHQALWGSEMVPLVYDLSHKTKIAKWVQELQFMVTSDDPIAYLGENL